MTGEWLVRGQTADLRGCTITDKVDCLPPYTYSLSADGNEQYWEIPVGEQFENRPPWENFASIVKYSSTDSTTEFPVEGADNVQSMITNKDGDQLVFFGGSSDEGTTAGYNLYQRSSGKTMSLNRALNACPTTDENGNEVDESSCQYISVPGAITSKAEHYTADGQHVLFRYISRFSAQSEQAVDNFLLDVEEAAVYSLPEYFAQHPEWISGDASVLMAVSDPYQDVLLVGRR